MTRFTKLNFPTYVTVIFCGGALALGGAILRSSAAFAQMGGHAETSATPASPEARGGRVHALNLKPDWHPPTQARDEDKIETRESDVVVNGVHYDRIEYEGKLYLVRLQKSDTPDASERFDCDSPARNDLAPRLAEAQVKVTERTRLFVEGLTKRCRQAADYNTATTLSPGGIAGVALEPGTPDGHEKKIIYNPLIGGAGFKTDW